MVITIENQQKWMDWLGAQLPNFQNNPSGMQRLMYQFMEGVTGNQLQMFDITNPFSFLMEMACYLTANAINEDRTNNRSSYPQLGQSEKEIFNHASPETYASLFAQPLNAKFSALISVSALNARMVYDPVLDCYKAVIPRNTEISFSDITFSLQYPIVIKRLNHGDFQVSYDASVKSPLQTLTTNMLQRDIRTFTDGTQWLYFDFDAAQFKINSNKFPINTAVAFSQSISLTDSFYYCRVWNRKPNTKVWNEIPVTQSLMVYDLNVPTCLLTVADGQVVTSIPPIYTINGSISGDLRVDVYETKGAISFIMDTYPLEGFSNRLLTVDENDQDQYVAAMNNVDRKLFTQQNLFGGVDEATFAAKRAKIINETTGTSILPINNVQITDHAASQNYTIVPNTDSLTNRIFLATRDLIPPTSTVSKSAPNAGIDTIIYSAANLADKTNSFVIHESDVMSRTILLPENIYRRVDGVVKVLTVEERNTLMSLDIDSRIAAINDGSYLYSPFHYVLDDQYKEFTLRPYYLDNPKVVSFRFESQKETSTLVVNTQAYRIVKERNAYKIYITTKSNAEYQALDDVKVFAQLSFVVPVVEQQATLVGALSTPEITGERTFVFTLNTDNDIDSDHYIQIKNLFLMNVANVTAGASLNTNFDIVYGVYSNAITGLIDADSMLVPAILDVSPVAITHEIINIELGLFLKDFWSRARTTVSVDSYETYTTNVPLLYTENVYSGGEPVSIVGGVVVINSVLHAIGDPVLDDLGNPVYLHQTGDVVIDNTGAPVLLSSFELNRQIDLLFIEGVYAFSNDVLDVAYINNVVSTIAQWITNDMVNISAVLLENSSVFFAPKKTLGEANVIMDGNISSVIPMQQFLTVNFFVKKDVYEDLNLRNKLTSATIVALKNTLKSRTVSQSDLINAAFTAAAGNAVEVYVSGLGITDNKVITVIDPTASLTIGKVLTKLPGNNTSIRDSVVVDFQLHMN